jgi:lipid II:glycine glycyltransferase (peptidoglycan interpeptide bridge formation enzyme)
LNDLRRRRGCRRAEVHWELPEMPAVHEGSRMLLHVTELPGDPEKLFASFHRTRVQQPIRSAENMLGLTTYRGRSWNDMLTFYALHLETRRRLGVPVQPLRFFRLLWEKMIANDLGFTLFTYWEQMPVAGGVFLRMGDTLTYKFGASLEEYWPENPNHLLLWNAMRYGIEKRCRKFDWGKTDPEHAGLREFKLGWGSRERAMTGAIVADAPPEAVGSGRSRRLVEGLIRRSPRWVCRTIGELFYGQLA